METAIGGERQSHACSPLTAVLQSPWRPPCATTWGGTSSQRGGQTRRCQNNGVLSILRTAWQGWGAKVREWVVPILLGLVGHSRDLDLLSLQLEAVGGFCCCVEAGVCRGQKWTQRHLGKSLPVTARAPMRGYVAQPGGSQREVKRGGSLDELRVVTGESS